MFCVIASNNKKKVEELKRILTPLDIIAKTPAELGVTLDEVEETGSTFRDNAELKAVAAMKKTGFAAIADDSGLCVDALGGRPGVFSARYAETDEEKINKIVSELNELGNVPRTAHFTCVICLAYPDGRRLFVEERCDGEIGFAPRGSGGFGYDLERVAKYAPQLEGFVSTNSAGATGDGLDMAMAIGAATVDLEQIQIHPSVYTETKALITEGIRGDGAILVNQKGERFVNELLTRDAVSAAELEQEGGYAYTIVDQKMMDASATYNGYFTKGYAVQADTYEALAEATGMDPDVFAETMNTWNAACEKQVDEAFGRTSFASPLDTAPFYAIKVAPGIHHCMGGVVIDTGAHVLDEAGNAIPGLYAAGEVTGGVHGANRLGGNAVADIVVFGRIAGENAAKAE